MIYGFARQSGGQVRIYSEVGQGTTVCLYLPRHHGDGGASADAAPDRPTRRAPSRARRCWSSTTSRPCACWSTEVLEDLGYTAHRGGRRRRRA